MKLTKSVYEKLLQVPNVPIEVGGIIGGKEDKVHIMLLDNGKMQVNGLGTYTPDVNFLNHCINKWIGEGIDFMGMFHTHAICRPTLSYEDREYITSIMNAMPATINKLYFPLVFPSTGINVFYAERENEQVNIVADEIEII